MPTATNGRISFAEIKEVAQMPDFIETQRRSYENFLQATVRINRRENKGLEACFRDVFPIVVGNVRLEYVNYSFGLPKYGIDECIERGVTYAAPLKVKLRLIVKTQEGPSVPGAGMEIRETQTFMGEIPLMTPTGTFVINGAERVIVSQLHRSPGVSFFEDTHPSGKRIYGCRIIPFRGAWLEFELDAKDIIYVSIDRKKKIPSTVLLRAFTRANTEEELLDEEILRMFYKTEKVNFSRLRRKERLIGRIIIQDLVETETGWVFSEGPVEITESLIQEMEEHHVTTIELIDQSEVADLSLVSTLQKDPIKTSEETLIEIYGRLRPGNPPTLKSAETLFRNFFLEPRRYNFGVVGRYRLNHKLGIDVPVSQETLTWEDIREVIRYLLKLRTGEGAVDDIDHLGNRRIRSVGELLQEQFRIGLARMEKSIREKINISDMEDITPHNLINSKPLSAVIREFFGRSQLSQFMDQTNPLAELTHKRRLSALGPGGLTRERAGFEVRDVHFTHYGRICPIETPEGPNIGLITSLCTYARINDYGFCETPYRKVENGVATAEIVHMSADVEDRYIIAQANAPLDSKGHFVEETVMTRLRDDFIRVPCDQVQYMDVSPKQTTSISAALIPFLEHDDANRALMGSNMQRQAVPLLSTEAPLVGTGLERKTAVDSGVVLVADKPGVVTGVSGRDISIRYKGDKTETRHRLHKFMRSNQNTCYNQRPVISIGDKVEPGAVLADGPSTDMGELALGKNVLVAFMPWHGYNFEDAILLSERLITDDVYTSIHIEEFQIEARDTKLGREEITKDIPGVAEELLENLDEDGVVRVGTEVRSGDILVGKVTPKGQSEPSSEEKLLRAIFGEKVGDYRDSSLKVSPGVKGIIIDAKVFSRKERSSRQTIEDEKRIRTLKIERDRSIAEGIEDYLSRAQSLLGSLKKDLIVNDVIIYKAGTKLDEKRFEELQSVVASIPMNEENKDSVLFRLQEVCEEADSHVKNIDHDFRRKVSQIRDGDELPPGVIKVVKVYLAQKRKLQVGDKMAGRHGNKGVVAKILPLEDMPYLEDGTPVDIVLNPLGVPSRLNVGQLLETHLGWAAKALGLKVATPVFDGASEDEIRAYLKNAGLPEDGKASLYDGLTGKRFDQRVTVGYIYMMKLGHMVDDKIHARSIGPYSLVTQQPLGGKAQFGGQRFGEMEVWALEGYGAAYTLQELLTVKSDDVTGRTRIYESIVKGENTLRPGVPESFNVLVKELQGLCLNLRVEEYKRDTAEEGTEAGAAEVKDLFQQTA